MIPIVQATVHSVLERWLSDCDVRDEHGQPVRVTPHQWRHTFGTRLINNDVPQDVVRQLLDHNSAEMTAHYARMHDTTVREHWERARKVNIHGHTVQIPNDSPLADAAWMNQHLGRATMALPNGYCGLPLQQSCPHANACLTCAVFITTPEFLGQHREQLAHTQLVLEGAKARKQLRLVETNQRVCDSLTNIIAALDAEETSAR
ncbi:MAG TPA: tyrosine-type recombinase/integrase [Pseudonocardiaceae bacterium]|nr:tyrosine-type recombinase/integrase [Pseudonocardiaceae bacterium]